MMSTAPASVRPRTSRRLRMRNIHVIYADSNSADFAGFKNRLESVQTQQERDRQTRLERRRQQERERHARETPEERDGRRSLRNQSIVAGNDKYFMHVIL